ncbi:MAG: flagellar biosynthetic protein FliO [Alphaproteobacteria bacterium]|nr:flagellar biosynthetic protein FliO [Alphaproteobacteria bacterium]MBV9692979.1 flagellar biosynthetic protein FliO [Alphaproteobacteria bacterium]
MELIDIGRYFAALLIVLALVGFAGLALRRFGMPGIVRPQAMRRLQVVESLVVGPRQRLLLLRRDGVEHLVMSGPEGIATIECGIEAPAQSPAIVQVREAHA